mgnify:FL=1
MEQTADKHTDDITDRQAVLFAVPETCKTKCGERKEIITAGLERRQEVAAA